MANEVVTIQTTDIEQVLIGGDLSKLNQDQRVRYVQKLCNDLGLNILTRPFDYITLNGKLTLYANKGCAEQLRNVKKISVTVTSREQIGDLYVVTAQARLPDGREDGATGAVNITGLKGEALANAMMKAETKAKRRVTLSAVGLNMLDDSEVDSIPGAQKQESELNAKYAAKPEVKQDEVVPPPALKDAPKIEGSFEDFNEQKPSLDSFRIKVGGKDYNGKTFGEVGKEKLAALAKQAFDFFQKKNQPLSADWQEFFQNAEIYCFGN